MGCGEQGFDRKILIPYSTQRISLGDRIKVFKALSSPFLTQGPEVTRFEKAIADFTGATHGVAVNSATSALHLACIALELGPGDIMWTTPISFVASANCALYTGASVEFVDIDPKTWNISVSNLEEKLVAASASGTLPKVLVVVHFAGEPAEMNRISELSKKFGFKIIEDASHALGSRIGGHLVGCGRWSEITVFSFHAVKNITTGEGGMAVTNVEELAESMRAHRSHGITREVHKFKNERRSGSSWYYEQQVLGFNYRLTDFQAVLGISQLKRLEANNERRREIARLYNLELSDLESVNFQECNSENLSAQHLCVVELSPTVRDAVHQVLQQNGVGTNLHYIPIHLHPFHFRAERQDLRVSEHYGSSALSLPCHPRMTKKQVLKISNLLKITLDSLEKSSASA